MAPVLFDKLFILFNDRQKGCCLLLVEGQTWEDSMLFFKFFKSITITVNMVLNWKSRFFVFFFFFGNVPIFTVLVNL